LASLPLHAKNAFIFRHDTIPYTGPPLRVCKRQNSISRKFSEYQTFSIRRLSLVCRCDDGESLLEFLPAHAWKQFHRFREPSAHQPRLPAADGVKPVHHAYLLRRRFQQRCKLQSPFPGNKRHDAERVSPACQPSLRRLTPIKAPNSPLLDTSFVSPASGGGSQLTQ